MKKMCFLKWFFPLIALALVSCVDNSVPDGGGTTLVINGKGYDPVLKSSTTKNNRTGILLVDNKEFRGVDDEAYAYVVLSNSLLGKTIDLSNFQGSSSDYFSIEITNERDSNGYIFVSTYDLTQASGTMTIVHESGNQYRVEMNLQSAKGAKAKVSYRGSMGDAWPASIADLQ